MMEVKHPRDALSATTQEATSKFGARTTETIYCIQKRKEEKNVTEKGQIYVCEICGNKVQVLETGAGTLVCCGQDMTLVQ